MSALKLDGSVYKIPIYFFSNYEINSLLSIQELLRDPEKYFKEVYIPFKPIDTFTYVYEKIVPAYHSSPDCFRLSSIFENFTIPQEIKDKGIEVVEEFREWFEGVKDLLDEDIEIFEMRLHARWGVVTNPRAIKKKGAGFSDMLNISVADMEKRIDELIKDAGRFYYVSDKNKIIIKKYSHMTYLAYKEDPMPNNDTVYNDSEIKILLREYDELYKTPLKIILIEYYKLKLNPKIEMKGYLLDKIGFKPCSYCCKN